MTASELVRGFLLSYWALEKRDVILYLWGMSPLAYLAYFSMLKDYVYILVYGARRLLMLDGDSLILLDVMRVVLTTCFILSR